MGAIVNGLNLHYFRAFGGTFFNFNDYMKGAVRLAALMQLPAIFVYTHDSIGLGANGPSPHPGVRAARAAARHAADQRRAAGGRERDRAGLALWHSLGRRSERARALA